VIAHGDVSIDRAARPAIADILPTLPLQKAMLLYRETSMSDPGFIQVRGRLKGVLDLGRFTLAWEKAMECHPGLRASIRPRKNGEQMLVVWAQSRIPIRIYDVRGSSEPGGELLEILERDREEGLDVATSPVMRLTIVRLDDDEHELIWACHHLFVDGWSSAVVLDDVLAIYNGTEAGDTDTDVLRRHHRWLAQRDMAEAGRFWRSYLSEFDGNEELRLGEPGESGVASLVVEVPTELTRRAGTVVKHIGATPSSLVQLAWGAALARLLDADDVVFGTTVSGRAAIVGMERAVGYFANVVPIRVALDPRKTVSELLIEIRTRQFQMQPHESCLLSEIHGWSELPGHMPLFDSFLVVENFPLAQGRSDGALRMEGFSSGLTTAYPLTVAVTMGDSWAVHAQFDTERCESVAVEALVHEFLKLLDAIVTDPTAGSCTLRNHDETTHISNLLRARSRDRAIAAGPVAETATERVLTAIWSDLLGWSDISTDDDYFELGGTSIMAVTMFGRIADQLGKSLPLNMLLVRPTVKGLASVIDGVAEDPLQFDCLVPINTGGSETPLFCVHAGGGNALSFRDLAKSLGRRQPVYGFAAVGLNGEEPLLETVSEMAARYVSELRRVQPDGPYRLLGSCFGGAVALEMAGILEAANEDVELLVLIDAGLPLEASRRGSLWDKSVRRLHSEGPWGVARGAIALAGRRGKRALDSWFGDDGDKQEVRRSLVVEACQRAFGAFDPKPTSAPIVLFKVANDDRGNEGVYWHTDWQTYGASFDVVPVDTRHDEIMQPPAVDDIAGVIKERLPG